MTKHLGWFISGWAWHKLPREILVSSIQVVVQPWDNGRWFWSKIGSQSIIRFRGQVTACRWTRQTSQECRERTKTITVYMQLLKPSHPVTCRKAEVPTTQPHSHHVEYHGGCMQPWIFISIFLTILFKILSGIWAQTATPYVHPLGLCVIWWVLGTSEMFGSR